uniref:Zinc finger DNA-directed DNA polymerase family B alpha domain-containing protein n=1 Tax=Timema bartmani TaxID=61472 RepID=A0A7R9ETT5_9NEOP|nr:unnamed protein product [Timema bartmani]
MQHTVQCGGQTDKEVEATVQGCNTCQQGNQEYLSVEKCCNPECSVRPIQYLTSIQNQLNWLICEDPGCTNRTRRVPLHFSRNYPICTQCEKGVMFKEYNESQLYTQLSYFQHIFDLNKVAEKSKTARNTIDGSIRRWMISLPTTPTIICSVKARRTLDAGQAQQRHRACTAQEEVSARHRTLNTVLAEGGHSTGRGFCKALAH